MEIKYNLVNENKYGIKCPYTMNAECIVVHNTANDASAENEIDYMINNNNEVSYHYAIDDKEIIQAIPENRNAWHSGDGNGQGNRNGIAVEICYSKSGGERFEEAERNAVKFIAMKLKEKGWGIEKVKKHQDFSNKYCPHRTLDMGWDRFLNMIKIELGQTIAQVQMKTAEITNKIDVKYQAYTNNWYPDVINLNDYAGLYGQAITGFRGNTVGQEQTVGNLIYKVHIKGGNWLPEVIDRKDYAGIFGKPIDGLMIRSTKGTARYRVHLLNGSWLPFVSSYNEKDNNNGYAGILNKTIDGIQIEIV